MSPKSVLASRLEALLGRLRTRGAQHATVAVATLLAATSVGPHRALDDFVLSLITRWKGGPLGLHRGVLDLFTFTTGDPGNNRELMDAGLMLPWWTDPGLRISFFRPLSSLTHFVDERLFPSSAVLMHAHSLAWFSALLVVVSFLYRRLEASPELAGLSLALYAVDHTHGPALAWLANRNALIATLFGCLSIVAHHAHRQEGRRAGGVLAPLFLLLGLLGGEAAVGAVAYLVAYALVRDAAPLRSRLTSLVPYGAVVVVWRVLWNLGGFGARGSGAYIDPLASPGAFLRVLPEKLVVLFHGQFSAPPSDLAFLGPPPDRPLLVAIAVATVLAVSWVLLPVLRRDASSRFWALGMGLSLLPLAATFPSDRLLSFAGLGAMPLLSRLFSDFLARAGRGEPESLPRALVVTGLFALHAVVSPFLLPLRAAQMELFGRAHDRAARGIPSTPSIEGKTVVVVATPTVLFANYVQAEREVLSIPRPEHLYLLASASSPIVVERSGERRLVLRPREGFLYTPLERHYRGTLPFHAGDEVRLSRLTATVEQVGDDGRPLSVAFDLTGRPDEYSIVTWDRGRFVPFTMPEIGGRTTLPEEDFGKILVQAALSPGEGS